MMLSLRIFIVGVVTMCVASIVYGQAPIVYPAQGQSAAQMSQDKFQCSDWATSQTGVKPQDPASVDQAATAVASQTGAQVDNTGAPVVRNAAGGAAAGAAIGAIAGDAGKGAAIDATAGAFRGARQRRQGKK